MTDLSRGDILERIECEVIIDDFGFTGEGFVRLSDGWLSVPGALPGEKVIVRLQPGQREQSRRLYADIVQILSPSKMRRDPLCDRDSICRGCQLRHLTVAEELSFKVRCVREVIDRYAGLTPEEQPEIEVITPQPISRGDAFRIRSNLSYLRKGPSFELGLHSPVIDGLVSMDSCPALTLPVRRLVSAVSRSLESSKALPWDEAMVREVGQQVRGFEVSPGIRSISVVAPTHGVGLMDVKLTGLEGEESFQRAVKKGVIATWLERLAGEVPDRVGVAVHFDEFRHIIKEPQRIRVPIGKWQMEIGYDDWFHATMEPAEQVYERLMHWLDLGDEDRFLDVGCGTGTISLMASEKAREVVGIDANRASIEAAEINALGHECENVRFVAGGWEKALRQLVMDKESFTAATINPMREPLGHRPLAFLQALGIKRIVYLGPSPEAAARDVGALRQMGWSVRRLGAANLHPATYHTLLMAALEAP